MGIVKEFLRKVKRVRHGYWDCLEWQGTRTQAGYGRFWLGGLHGAAHRMAYTLFVGPIPMGMLVCHRCDNRRCVNPDHLFLGTHKENTQDAVAKNRISHGSKRYNAKVSESQIPQIVALYNAGWSQQKITNETGISRSIVRAVLSGNHWKHVERPRKKAGQNRPKGESNHKAKLTVDDVQEIRRLHGLGIGSTTLGRRYGVSKFSILCIVNRRTWQHVA